MKSIANGRVGRSRALKGLAPALLALSLLSGCSTLDQGTITRGYVFDDQTLAQVKVGAPAEQVLALLGTPTTTSTVGGDAWYYISQRVEQPIPAMPAKVTNQRVYAVYFDKNKRVTRIANYGLEDGRVIDMTSRQTVAGGGENRLLQGMLKQISGLKYQMF
ncbi:outer membrane protein assembly factor BamE (lipoprotein component of BamABCDE complex) [Rhodoblastus acidophilus]|uniref:outer membrane protein assembly factor BamE n=1 Tax=Rhodoblastus acidophilus TaxID=1074 RepID=UPI0022258B02|nr:outer membrane protein assembly factor BamE [Rhodoblastus acidophilus]MCW2284887.1 outer membrane protein assembly factor BamE (lipoprotein component of BamABCDE complex) [Rhodoblastus acidophilus]MCW2333823.1 outer membrane protein assembly factor BamE (lipoprotein component of BamABCDE complex) [Rhodoblastus acidophilus]